MTEQLSVHYKQLLQQVLALSPNERIALLEELAASFRLMLESKSEYDPPFTTEEIAELMRVDPLPPAEVVAQGLLGTWAEFNIRDGAEWINEQKEKRKRRDKWQML